MKSAERMTTDDLVVAFEGRWTAANDPETPHEARHATCEACLYRCGTKPANGLWRCSQAFVLLPGRKWCTQWRAMR